MPSKKLLFFTVICMTSALHILYTGGLTYSVVFKQNWNILWRCNNYGEGLLELAAFILIALVTPFALRYFWRKTES